MNLRHTNVDDTLNMICFWMNFWEAIHLNDQYIFSLKKQVTIWGYKDYVNPKIVELTTVTFRSLMFLK